MKRYDFYIFDLDNTLVDSRKGYEEAFMAGFKEFDMNYDPDLYNEYIGTPLDITFSKYHPNSPRKCREFIRVVMETYDMTCQNGVRLFPDAERCIHRLIGDGRVLGIVSNAYMSQIVEVLNKLGVEDLFASVVGRDRVAFAKPDPEPVLLCMKEMGAARENSLMIGDSVNDILAGKGAGIFTALISRGGADPSPGESDIVIESLDEV